MSHNLPFILSVFSHFSKFDDVPFFSSFRVKTVVDVVVDAISLCQFQLDPGPDLPATPSSFCDLRLEGEASRLDESIGDLEADDETKAVVG